MPAPDEPAAVAAAVVAAIRGGDLAALRQLIDRYPDLVAALDNAIGYGCWHVARRLVERGARVDKLCPGTARLRAPRSSVRQSCAYRTGVVEALTYQGTRDHVRD